MKETPYFQPKCVQVEGQWVFVDDIVATRHPQAPFLKILRLFTRGGSLYAHGHGLDRADRVFSALPPNVTATELVPVPIRFNVLVTDLIPLTDPSSLTVASVERTDNGFRVLVRPFFWWKKKKKKKVRGQHVCLCSPCRTQQPLRKMITDPSLAASLTSRSRKACSLMAGARHIPLFIPLKHSI